MYDVFPDTSLRLRLMKTSENTVVIYWHVNLWHKIFTDIIKM